MSHYTRVRTALSDPAILAAALEHLGFTHIELHERPQKLRGYAGRTEQAEIIIRREHLGSALGDLGFARSADGTFEVIVDSSDRTSWHSTWLSFLATLASSLRWLRSWSWP